MTSYTVKLHTFDGRIVSVDVSAVNRLQAATAAVCDFVGLRENIDCASAIVVEQDETSFSVFQPREVLPRLRRRHDDRQDIGDPSLTSG